MSVRLRHGALLSALFVLGCGAGQADPEAAASETVETLAVRTLSEPLWEIGDFLGTTDQTLDFVAGAATFSDGRIAVLDQGASQLLVFDDQGTLHQRIGRDGDGPGEFRTATDLRLRSGDSIWVLDSWGMSVSQFTPEGEYLDEFPATELSQSEIFPLDAYFHDRFWVDGALTPGERARVNAILDRSTFPIDRKGFRFVQVADDGSLWIREQLGSGTQPSEWVVLSDQGELVSLIELPANFDPLEMRGDDILGRWRDELDVNYIRRYQLVDAGRTAEVPGWLADPQSVGPETSPQFSDSARATMLSHVKNLASLQEINYANSGSYTTNVDSLFAARETEIPDELGLHVLFASSRGWGMVLSMEGYEDLCGLSYGFGTPPGFYGGKTVCGRPKADIAPTETGSTAKPSKNREE